MTLEDGIREGMVAGAPFPDIYDWTWGELREFVLCRHEARRRELREDAQMYFRTASLIARMVMGKKGEEYKVVNEFPWLWTDEERKEMRVQELMHKFDGKTIN